MPCSGSQAALEPFRGEPAEAGAQYYLVCSGSLVHEGRALPELSMVLVEPGEAAAQLKAGASGCEVLFMQLPRPSERAGSRLRTLAERGLSEHNKPEGVRVDDDARH